MERSTNTILNWLSEAKNFILAIIAILTAINTYYVQTAESKIKRATQEMETNMKQRQFENELRFRVFEEVKQAVTTTPANRKLQKMIGIIVEEMLKEDSNFRKQMVNIIELSDIDSTVKTELKTNEQFKTELAQIIETSEKKIISGKPNFVIDIFYLLDVPEEGPRLALKIREKLDLKYKQEDGYIIRLRPLPVSVNKKAGYQIDRNQIRYEQGELLMAEEISRAIDQSGILDLEKIILKPVNNKTPNYISVFIRNR